MDAKADKIERPLTEYDTGIEGFVRFCGEVLNIVIWSKQREIAQSVIENRRTAVRSGHYVGKTTITACICEWWFSCRGLCFLTTAPGRDAVKDGVWKKIKAHREGANRPLPGKVLDEGSLKVDGAAAWWGKGFSTNKSERAQGKHAPGLLVVADEAAGVESFIWEALESSMASEEVRMLIIGNPNLERGYFFKAFHKNKDMWYLIHISSKDSPNVTGLEPSVPGLADAEWIRDQTRNFSDEPNTFRCRVLGEWPEDDAEEKVIPYGRAIEAQALWLELEEEEKWYAKPVPVHCAFADMAGQGKDFSTLVALRGQRFHIEKIWKDKSAEQMMLFAAWINDWVCALPKGQKPKWIAIDCDAVGVGCWSRLVQYWKANRKDWGRCKPLEYHWGFAADAKDKYVSSIDELHWRLREGLDPTRPREDRLALPPGEIVAQQVNLRKYGEDIRERKQVESKQKFKSRGEKSPDIADAIVGCMYRPKIVKGAS